MLLLIIPVLYILLQLWQELVILKYRSKPGPEPGEWPQITVMVAARNEEDHIRHCLQSLLEQDYPEDKILILVGNDQSTDSTADIVAEFAARTSRIKLIDIQDDPSGLKAKARVMAQLDTHAMGSFYLITDADVAVNRGWARHMVTQMNAQTGVASGTTMVKGSGLWSKMQELDWTYFMGLLNVISYSGVPATAVGNNMIVRTDAYRETGGYAAIRFSITEDYKLYSEICARGWGWNNVMSPGALAYSAPTRGLMPLLHQRKRWLSGGRELPWYWWLMFGVFAGYYFCIIPASFLYPVQAGVIALVKFSLQTLQINGIYRHLGVKRPALWWHLCYEFYLVTVTILTAFFFIIPVKTVWKGRKY